MCIRDRDDIVWKKTFSKAKQNTTGMNEHGGVLYFAKYYFLIQNPIQRYRLGRFDDVVFCYYCMFEEVMIYIFSLSLLLPSYISYASFIDRRQKHVWIIETMGKPTRLVLLKHPSKVVFIAIAVYTYIVSFYNNSEKSLILLLTTVSRL